MDIFSTLFRYCTFAPENYLTEAFVYLIIELLKREPEIGLALINELCGFSSDPRFLDASSISCNTQVTLDEGRPDIEIRDRDRLLVYIEVKHDSVLHNGQLEAYKSELNKTSYPETQLVLLTRSKQSALETTLKAGDFYHYCWYQVHNFLHVVHTQDKVAEYLIEQFLVFLEEKSMDLKRITWDYIEGVPALLNLINMVEASIQEVMSGVKFKRTGGWNWRGFYVGNIFCGVRYDEPLKFVFENNGGWHPTYKKDLDLEATHFFSLKNGDQFDLLTKFIKDSYQDMPKKDETINAAPPKDEETVVNSN